MAQVLAQFHIPTLQFLVAGCLLVLGLHWVLVGVDAWMDRHDNVPGSAP